MKTKVLELIEPINSGTMSVQSITLREPTAAEYLRLGDPIELHTSADGSLVPIVDHETISAYLNLCLVDPPGLALARVGLADGMALKEALLDFFGDARRAGSKTAPNVSSGISDGAASANFPASA